MANIKKIFFSILFFFLIFINISYSDIVEKVEVTGNERISNETIIIFGDVVVGKNYETSDINSLIKKLYETSFFSYISAEIKNNKLSITVKENPIINTITFDGEKAKKFKDKIKELLELKEKGSFVETNVKHDINQIKAFYRSLGFYFVKIDAEVERLKKNRLNLIYTVD